MQLHRESLWSVEDEMADSSEDAKLLHWNTKTIVPATMTLHNYVRFHDEEDIHFVRCDRDPDYVPTIPERYKKFVVPSHASDTSTIAENGEDMDVFRQELATSIALSWWDIVDV